MRFWLINFVHVAIIGDTRILRCMGKRDVISYYYCSLFAVTITATVPNSLECVNVVDDKLLLFFFPLMQSLLLQMSGVSWWLLCAGWSSDCFWGHLTWPEICRWLCLPVLFSVDYQAFFFTCLAAAYRRQWLEAFNQGRFRETVYRVW